MTDSSNSLSRAFTKEALSDIAEWAVAYCLDTYGKWLNEPVSKAPFGWVAPPLQKKKRHAFLQIFYA
jgi:hypothetical protein